MFSHLMTEKLSSGSSVKRGKVLLLAFAFSANITLFSACSLLPSEEQVLAPPLIEPPKVQYETYTLTKKSIQKEFRGSGSFIPVKEYALSFRNLSGKLDKLHVRINDEVTAGQVLAELDPGDLPLKISQKELDVQKAEIKLKQLDDEVADIQRNIELARIDLENAEVWYKVEQTRPREEEVKKSRIKLEQAEQKLVANSRNKEVARLDMESAILTLNEYKSNLEKSKLISPVDGKVTFVEKVAEGDTINAYKNIIVVADPTELQLSYTSQDLSPFRVGMSIEVKIKDKNYNAVVAYTPSSAPLNTEPKLKNTITLTVQDLPQDIKIGDTASFIIITEKKDNVIVIPKQGLRTFGPRNFVEVLDGNSKRERDVEKGIETATEVEIVKGVTEGQTIILR